MKSLKILIVLAILPFLLKGKNSKESGTHIAKSVAPGVPPKLIIDHSSTSLNSEILTLICPDDFDIQLPIGTTTTPVNWTPPTTSTTCDGGIVTFKQVPDGITNGSIQPAGVYGITYVALDNCDNFMQCSFTITVSETIPPTETVCIQINNICEDAEEENGVMDATSNDLDMGKHIVGLIFNNTGIPAGATISSASIQFTSSKTRSGLSELKIQGEKVATDDCYFTNGQTLSSRVMTDAVVNESINQPWIEDNEYEITGLESIVQEIVNQPSYSERIAFIIDKINGGKRDAFSYDGSAGFAPRFCVEYTPPVNETVCIPISNICEDVEEENGVMDATSNDLDMGKHIVGLIFSNTGIPAGATISSASIQFTSSKTRSGLSELKIQGEKVATDDCYFTNGQTLSSRVMTDAVVNESINQPWIEDNEYEITGLESIVQEIVNQPSYNERIAFIIDKRNGGRRDAYSFDDDPNRAAILCIGYRTDGSVPCNDLISDDFERATEYGNWNDGGTNCGRVQANAYMSEFCVRLRDFTQTSLMHTDLDLTGISEVQLNFTYVTEGMVEGDQFVLELSGDGGANYMTYKAWGFGTNLDFINGIREFVSLPVNSLPPTALSTTRFRLRNEASGQSHAVFIDDVVITTCLDEEPVVAKGRSQNEEDVIKSEEIKIYPVPTSENFFIDLSPLQNMAGQIVIYNLQGQQVLATTFDADHPNILEIAIPGLSNNVYTVSIRSGQKIFKAQKLVVLR